MNFKDYFQDELAYINLLAEEFSEEFPELKEFLSHSNNDPDVHTLFENFAFLTARLRQKIEDDFPELTYHLLEKIYPSPLRALPATTIVQFEPQRHSRIVKINKGAVIKNSHGKKTRNQRDSDDNGYCFTVSRDVSIYPLKINKIINQPSEEGGYIEFDFTWIGETITDLQPSAPINLYIGGDRTVAGLLLLWLDHYLKRVELYIDGDCHGVAPDTVRRLERTAGNALFPTDLNHFWRLQMIQEHFSLPHINDFVQLNFEPMYFPFIFIEQKSFKLRCRFTRRFPEQLLLDQRYFQLNSIPVVNLFPWRGDERHFDSATYQPELPQDKQLYSIDKIEARSFYEPIMHYLPVTEFQPQRFPHEQKTLFYYLEIKKDVIEHLSYVLHFIDAEGKPAEPEAQHRFCCHYLCMNDATVSNLDIGTVTTVSDDIPSDLTIHHIAPITDLVLPRTDSEHHWKILSHLNMNPNFLVQKEFLQSLLMDFDYYHHQENTSKFVFGVNGIKIKPMDWLFKGVPVRGLNMIIELDYSAFANEGEMYRIGYLISQVFPFCVFDNSFLNVEIINNHNKEVWSFFPIKGCKSQI